MAKRMTPKSVNNLIVVSDLHCGCQAGLCPPNGIGLDEGGHYQPSALQQTVWKWWQEFWDVWVPSACHNEPYAVAVNGDALDGRHHGATHQVSQNLADQARIAEVVLRPIVERCAALYLIRGTEAHVGASAENEERLGRAIGAKPDEQGRYARPELRVRIGGRSCAHLMHHIGTTGTSHYESSAVLKELVETYSEAGRWGRQPFDAVVRSHRHRFIMVTVPTSRGYGFSFVTPGWQLKTPFTYKIPGGRVTTPQVGGSLLRQGDEDFYTRHFVRDIDPPKEEIL
ncbi:MAG TPA: hypothetical protein VMY42_10675 [Thermoguttaceae bacterium]|nr:hypothetical protein [Thermoguttaceae bacterium]